MKYIFTLLLLFIFNCTHNWGSFKEYSVDAPANLEEVGTGTVEGSDCGTLIFWGGWYTQSLSSATREALKKVPGATGLKNAIVKGKHYPFFACMFIEGTPVKEKTSAAPVEPTPAKKGKK